MTRLEQREPTATRTSGKARSAMVVVAGLLVAGALALGGCGDKKKGLRIENISPKTGPVHGGGQVTIYGSGFQADGATAVNVYFGKRSAKVIAFEGDTKLIVQPPPGTKDQTVDVMLVFGDGRPFTYPEAFTYQDPNEGFGVDELAGGDEE